MPDIIIETDRLILRTQAEGDFDVWMQEINTQRVKQYLGGVEEPHETETAFARAAAFQAKEGFSFWFVCLKETGKLIGICGLKKLDAQTAPDSIKDDIEIGWILGEPHWRKGYASEAASASLDYAFTHTDAPHVVALTSDSNMPSWRMMEKLDMQRKDEWEFHDPDFPDRDNPTIVYSITREQWNEHQEKRE